MKVHDLRSTARRRARRATWLATALAAVVVATPTAAAWSSATTDTSVTWAVTPADPQGADGRRWVDLTVDPGETVTEHVAVRNLSKVETTFSLTAADGYYTDSGRFNMLEANETSTDAGTWITVEPFVTVPAGETAVVPYELAVPENATPGDHAAGIAASIRTTTADSDGTEIGVDSRVGFRISTRVSGELAPALEVADVRADYIPSWSLFSPGRIAVTYVASNTGNTTLSIDDAVGEVRTEQGNLLPGESRTLTVAATEAWPLGLLFIDLVVEGAVPGDSLTAAPHAESIVLWAVPWLHLLAVAGIVLIILAIFSGRRRNKRRFERLLEEAREEGRRNSTEAVPTA